MFMRLTVRGLPYCGPCFKRGLLRQFRFTAKPFPFRWMSSDSESSSSSSSSNSDDAELSRAAAILSDKRVKRIVVLAGAGISTASGIPDFRTPGTGLYDNLSQYNLPWPEAVFDLEYFYSNPVPFYTLAKELYPTGRYRPNIAHHFIRLLHDQDRLLRVYTQNIDSLERMAGIPVDKLVEAHGTFLTATCTVCRSKVSSKVVKNAIDKSTVAKCPECHEVVKPDIVFFGEDLPERFWEYRKDLAQTDLAIIMGTSLEVYPFAGVADHVPQSIPRILINRELVGSFRYHNRPEDIVLLGSITETLERLTDSLDWDDDLTELMDNWKPNLNGSSYSNIKSSPFTGSGSRRPYSTTTNSSRLRSPDRLVSRFCSMTISNSTRSINKGTSNKNAVTKTSSSASSVPPMNRGSLGKPYSCTSSSKKRREILLPDVSNLALCRVNTITRPVSPKSHAVTTLAAIRQYFYPDSVSAETDSTTSSTSAVS